MSVPIESGGGHDASLDYHQRLVADPHRVSAYARALRAVVRPGDRVLDVGAGTGLLAMLAARAGASRVIAVESMPIVDAARRLVAHNGLADVVNVVHADVRELPPEPVDVIVSDCLGRFLVDDHMEGAMLAAARWLAPGGRVVPARVELVAAPVGIGWLAFVDTWRDRVEGLDLSPLAAAAEHGAHGVALTPEAVLAPPAAVGAWTPPGPWPAFDAALHFTVARPGRLRGLAGWMRVELAPGVVLDTAPGVESHWHQLLFPVPPTDVVAGDVVTARLALDTSLPPARNPRWTWRGEVRRASGERLATFDRRADGPPPAPAAPGDAAPREPFDVLHERGVAAFEAGDHAAASERFAEALAALPPGSDAETWIELQENLGLTRALAGRYAAAVEPLLSALDGGMAREQSARLLVDCCFRGGRAQDGARYLAAYERAFGAHPSGWRRG